MSYEAFVANCMLQINRQIEILTSRIKNAPLVRESKQLETIIDCSAQHDTIYRFSIDKILIQLLFLVYKYNQYIKYC